MVTIWLKMGTIFPFLAYTSESLLKLNQFF